MSDPRPELALALLAHGSPDPDWLTPVEQIAERLRVLAPALAIALATLEHGPALGDVVARLGEAGVRRVVVVPVFLSGGGRHLKRDVPELVARVQRDHASLEIALAGDALASDPAVLDALAAAALRRVALSSPA
ncbi:sirohydrochlorin chelatase [Nannocystis bainbridge]|uniref:CbiX/SirB N-terminal domain-containing protein n=1 Tax=Nannocystis bainbridge TaxID=2995303 RepID=A0ABT5EAT3_9BACT|nr:CbiX/SirB N-terminal domain-containing protein [Nannocystis bainbridge]MDC0722976.1 CbiX/SirB N-terminal domain-containing protein [Nannocystis bainbridge]